MSTEFLQVEWLGNTVADYGLAIATIAIGFIAIAVIRAVVMTRLRQWATRTATDLDDRLLGLIEQPIARLLGLGVIYLSLGNLTLHPILQDALNGVCVLIATLFVVQLTGSLVEYGVRVYWVTKRGDATLEQSLNAIVPAIKVVVWAIGAVFLLDNLGFDISAVVASLGIGGTTIAARRRASASAASRSPSPPKAFWGICSAISRFCWIVPLKLATSSSSVIWWARWSRWASKPPACAASPGKNSWPPIRI